MASEMYSAKASPIGLTHAHRNSVLYSQTTEQILIYIYCSKEYHLTAAVKDVAAYALYDSLPFIYENLQNPNG